MTKGLVGSLLLHAATLLLALLLMPLLLRPPPATESVMVVDLVQLGDATASPLSPDIAAVPQERAGDAALGKPQEIAPIAQMPPPTPAEREAAPGRGAPDVAEHRAERRETRQATVREKLAAPKSPQPATDELGARLRLLAQQHQLAPATSRQQPGSGASNATATSPSATPGQDATYRVKDFIRAQVERHWNLDRDAARGKDWTVAVHITLAPDGSVRGAEIVANPRYRTSAAYLDVARSARNAVLLSSPLLIPTGQYEIARDLVIDLDTKEALR